MHQLLECIDAGTEYCPCYLAESNECIMCSQLQGNTFCDCRNWKGVCIYQEYIWNRSRIKEGRREITCRIAEKKTVSGNLMILTLEVNRTLARELNEPGAYVFLRDPRDPGYFDTPMSVMIVNEEAGTLSFAVNTRGVKTKALAGLENEVSLRGPYWNGILGLKYLKGFRRGKALLVARGVGQAPAIAVARKLVLAGNQVDIVLDAGNIGVNFAEQYFRDLDCKIILQTVFDKSKLTVSPEALKFIKRQVEDEGVRLVYCGGPELMNRDVKGLIQGLEQEVYFACSNDAKLCCGEGICGSCQTRLHDGNRVITCKTQLNPMEII